MRPPLRSRALDLLVVLLAAGLSLALISATGDGPALIPQFSFWPLLYTLRLIGLSEPWMICVLACGTLWWRRRCPTALAVGLTAAGLVLPLVIPATVAVFSVAVYRPLRTTVWASGVAVAPVPLYYGLRAHYSLTVESLVPGLAGLALVAVAVGWGLFVRSLHERAERAEAEAALRAEQAQRAVREEIAREMHDVLAHRLSLLSVHAGALEFNPGAPADQVEHAAGVIRESAHRALQELRTVIGVLRAPTLEEYGATGPTPSLGDLERLVRESREAGMRVRADELILEPDSVPALTGRTVYRIAQEGLTNARKHAPGAVVRIAVTGSPLEGLTVELRNRAPQNNPRAVIPGSGQGLIGLAERAALAGGRLEHGRTGGDYHLRAWLPWAA
ncbi:sensor histidine kinase [Streptomyces sp. NPDC057136]|uniref:sensor histidine kinase n=1 Tax=Streptomyces sp. NPDC057136 TaxID=3346029 RepID=UPI0036329DC4